MGEERRHIERKDRDEKRDRDRDEKRDRDRDENVENQKDKRSTITKQKSKITVGAMKHKNENVPEKSFDLENHSGERIRIYIGNDDLLNIETRPRQKLLVCELDVPKKIIVHTKTKKKDDQGEFIVETKETERDLATVEVKEYLEKEVKKIIK